MTITQGIVALIVIVPLVFAALEKIHIDVAALLIAAMLGLAQFAGLSIFAAANTPMAATKAFSGFSQSVVITLISLFILTDSLDRAGVTRWIVARVLRLGGHSEWRLIGLFSLTAALLSLFMNNVAAGALLLPSAINAAQQTGVKPSKLLMPISFGTLLGGAATYFTTANIIASDLLTVAHPPQKPLGLLDFLPVGGTMALVGLLYLVLFGSRLLPNRTPPIPPNVHHGEPPPLLTRRQSRLVLAISGSAILASILGVPASLAMLSGALCIILLGITPMNDAYHVIEWKAIFPVAAMYAVGLAMQQTGLADLIGRALIAAAVPAGALGVIIETFLLTALLTQFIGGQVAANVTGPIAISAALVVGTNPQALAVVTAIGCSMAFLTPVAHPVNLLMVDLAGYRFSDFARVGVGMFIVCFIVVVIAVPVFWAL